MLGFGHGPELIILLGIALIVLGPGKIPELAQMLGKGIRELRKASSELQQTFDVNALMNPPAPAQQEAPEAAPPPAEPPVEHTILPPTPAPEPAIAASAAEPVVAEGAPAKPKRTRKRATPAGALAAAEVTPEAASTLEVEVPAVPAEAPAATEKPIGNPLQRPTRRRAAAPTAEAAPSLSMAIIEGTPSATLAAEAGGSVIEHVMAGTASETLPSAASLAGEAEAMANGAKASPAEQPEVAPAAVSAAATGSGAKRPPARRARRTSIEPVTADTSA